uniref:FERM domain-containing protein n=1 Tax=Megaselia scalaris TaxID=36166 RepID=T1GW82_MEGSC
MSYLKPESTTSSVTSLATTATSSVLSPLTSSSSSSSINFPDYFRIDEYLPFSLRTAWGVNALKSCHRQNRGMTRSDAEMNYIRQACALHDTINAHVYRMKMSKNENGPGTVWFVVYAKGIRIYGDNTQPITFLWPNIVKLSFERKKFEIRSGDNKITLYSASDEKSKMLLALCKETHQFSMKVATRLKDAIKREEDEGNYLNTCYMYSRSLNLPYKSKNDQRISVISSTSSNTTSGIVSDRVHSEDELEIMINTPPVAPVSAPSTESLAFSHLLDRSGVNSAIKLTTLSQHTPTNRQNSTSSSLELGFNHTTQISNLSDGASTCIDHDFISSNHDEDENVSGVYTLAHGAPPTETSGVYTINSSELTEQSSEIAESVSESHDSSHYGIFQPKSVMSEEIPRTRDSVDGGDAFQLSLKNEFRLRSDSSISVCESFRGDGSDPTDKSHTFLSAEELTELIVGRGTYPSRKSVSTTLDSDCDYVTLPLPMNGNGYLPGHQEIGSSEDGDLLSVPIPPQRIDSNPLPNLTNIRMRSPPPYNARHEKTGLSGPPLSNGLCLAKPPPPSSSSKSMLTTPLLSSNASNPTKSEEVPARFITTRSQINILKAHSGIVNETTKPSYAAPTISQPLITPNPQPLLPPYPHKKRSAQISQLSSNIGIPVVPYSIHSAHASHKSVPSNPTPRTTCVLLPVIKPRQYLPPPPPSLPRQPPPPPPQLATVYTRPLARSQIELYQQQLYSDVDYVIYPIQDPAEYLDSKQGAILAAMARNPPPPPYLAYRNHHSWDAYKSHAIYRSTPYLPVAFSSTQSRYASTQNLSDTYVQLPSAYSPIYSPSVTSLCSSYEPPPPLRPTTISQLSHQHQVTSPYFVRSRSDDNILKSIEALPKLKRQPPPPPTYVNRRLKKPPMPAPSESPPPIPIKPPSIRQNISNTSSEQSTPGIKTSPQNPIDIQVLREKSKHLDLPLISALCNDRSLLKQTKAFVAPKNLKTTGSVNTTMTTTTEITTTAQSISKPRKTSISHRHPNDKLPPLPVQT